MAYELKKTRALDELMNSTNICDLLDESDLTYIGNCVLEGYREDDTSRAEWKKRTRQSMDLALQVAKEKTFPWQHASNVKVPLITIAALQFAALAYPQIVDSPDLVKCMVYGADPDGQKNARASRIASHMSWQNMEQDKGWEEAHDKGLLVQPIVGLAFTKKIYDASLKHQVTRLVLPNNFVINYYTSDIESSPRYTHTFNLTANDIKTRELDKRFREYPEGGEVPKTIPSSANPDELKLAQDQRQGLSEPPESATTPYFTGEQYCWWDLDGDGYEEPYIVTFDIGTGFVRRIVARYRPSCVTLLDGMKMNEEGAYISARNPVYAVCPINVFTKIPFVPSPDGGFYDIGLGQLLGDINEAANSALNQLFDAGTMSTLGGGFLGRGFKNRAGPFSMRPFEWYPIDAPGDDLRKNILPLPIREPSPVLFQVLQFLVQFAERITQTTEIGMGENPGQNTPAQTTQTLDANGRRMMNAIFKRTWRAFRDEYRIQYELNQLHLEQSEDYVDLSSGQGAFISAADYTGPSAQVKPAADPFIISDVLKQQQSDRLIAMSQNLPGFNRYQTGLRALKSMKVQDLERVYPPLPVDPQTGKPMQDFPPPGPDPKMIQAQVAQGQLALKQAEFQAEQARAPIELLKEVKEAEAHILEMQANAAKLMAEAGSEQAEPIIKLIYAQIEQERGRRDDKLRRAEMMLDAVIEHRNINLKAKEKEVNTPAVPSPSDVIAQSVGTTMGTLQ